MASGIKLFDIVEVIGESIQNNVDNVDKNRENTRWVYPTFPKSKKILPQVTVQLENPQYSPDSGDDYLGEEYSNNQYKIYRYKRTEATLNFWVLSGKEQEFEVIYNNEKLTLSNQKLNIFIANQIKDFIIRNESKFFDFLSRFELNSIELAFDNNDYSWGSTIQCTVEYKDVWVETYLDGELISSYSTNLQTY